VLASHPGWAGRG